jgi:hypothetical protein
VGRHQGQSKPTSAALWRHLEAPEAILAALPFEPSWLLTPLIKREQGRPLMHKRYWLDYDPVALVLLVVGIGMIELLALSI